jgi:pyrroloquinoline quinone biosynthesis protein D
VVDPRWVDANQENDLSMNSCAPNNRPRLARHVRLQTDTVSGNPVLLLPEAVIVLNQTGYEILRLCDGAHTVPEIIQALDNTYPAARPILQREVSEYLQAISQKGLIAWT